MRRSVRSVIVLLGTLAACDTAPPLPTTRTEVTTQALGTTVVPVAWPTEKLDVPVQPGVLKSVSVTLTAKQNVPAATIQVPAEFAPFMTVSPATTPKLAKGTSLPLTLTFSLPEASDTPSIRGKLYLTVGLPRYDKKGVLLPAGEFIPMLLPIQIQRDGDGDAVPDDDDNCPFKANADQADLDGDGIGDVCGIGHAVIGPAGGEVSYPGLASATFGPNVLGALESVELARVQDAELSGLFGEVASGLFRVSTHSDYQVRLLLGIAPPEGDSCRVVFTVSGELGIPAGHRPELFVLAYQDAGMETIDDFQLFPSTYDAVAGTLTADVPTWLLTNARRSDGRYEALFMIGTTPGATPDEAPLASSSAALATAAAAGECQAGFIGSPLDASFGVSDPYGMRVHPLSGAEKMHWGTDYRVPSGTQVSAAADGRVERIGNQGGSGYGRYLILRHTDGSATLYGHLESESVSLGQTVRRGAPIALSDNSGGSTGAHLHFEYVPNGEIIKSKFRIDPAACVRERTVLGSITVRDNGNLADDSFAVYLDGIHIGTTEIGAANNFAINNLIPGDHTLRVQGVVVPDNVGTYEILLASGITFTNGTIRLSGTVTSGGSASFVIIVPDAPSGSSGPGLSLSLSLAPAGTP